MIFITGASGFIGTNLAGKLAKQGYKVKCFVRKSSNISALKDLGVEIAYGDITDKESISRAMGKNSIVVHLAAVTSEVSSDYNFSRKINVVGTRNLLDVCRKKKAARIIHLTSESTKRRIKGAYARTKAEADGLVKGFGTPYTIIRPSIVYGAGSRGLFQKTLDYIEKMPLVPIIGAGKERIIPVHVDDVTDAIIACIKSEKTENKEYDLTGATMLDFNQFMDGIMGELGIRKGKIHIPFSFVYLGAKILSIFMKNPPVTTDNLLGLKQEVRMDYGKAKKDFGFKPLTFEQGLKRTFYNVPSDSKKNIAVVGFGKMGLLHASIIRQIPNARLAAIMDRNMKAKQQMKSLGINVPFFTSVEKMLDNVKIDGAFICVPPSLNHVISHKLIEKGISVFVEKPMSNNPENAEKMLDYANKKKITTSCGYMVAYFPVFQEIKRIIDSKKYGKVKTFDSYCYISQVFRKKSSRVWHYDARKTGGGVLITMASHLIFLLQWYFGKCISVSGKSRPIYTKMDDEVSASLNFGSVAGTLKTSWSIKGYENLTWIINLDMEKAVIRATNSMISIKDKKTGKITEMHASELKDDAGFELGGKGYYSQDHDFINSIGTKKEPLSNWKNSLNTQKIIDAIYASIKAKKEIKL